MGDALGIEGPDQTAPDLSTIQPDITATIMGGNSVKIGWSWQGFSTYLDLLEIEVDRGDGKGFLLLDKDSTPNFIDTAPFPSTPIKWTYRAIFRVGDSRVGIWSNPVSIIVGG
jgi:hypothetical protein